MMAKFHFSFMVLIFVISAHTQAVMLLPVKKKKKHRKKTSSVTAVYLYKCDVDIRNSGCHKRKNKIMSTNYYCVFSIRPCFHAVSKTDHREAPEVMEELM